MSIKRIMKFLSDNLYLLSEQFQSLVQRWQENSDGRDVVAMDIGLEVRQIIDRIDVLREKIKDHSIDTDFTYTEGEQPKTTFVRPATFNVATQGKKIQLVVAKQKQLMQDMKEVFGFSFHHNDNQQVEQFTDMVFYKDGYGRNCVYPEAKLFAAAMLGFILINRHQGELIKDDNDLCVKLVGIRIIVNLTDLVNKQQNKDASFWMMRLFYYIKAYKEQRIEFPRELEYVRWY